MSARRSVLLLSRAPPYGGPRARDALDVAMAFGAFDQTVTLLLLGDAVLLLKRGQQDGADAGRNLERLSGALPDYGIEAVCVEQRALVERGLEPADLAGDVRPVDDAAIAALIAGHEVVLSL